MDRHSNSSSMEKQQHLNPSSSKILCQFRVTKLRSWRTGYARILVIYERDFATLDPDTRRETNRWSLSQLADFMVIDSNAILISTVDDKLKFSCDDRREKVLLALLRQQDASGQASQLQRLPIFGNCSRWKRNGIQQSVILQVQSFALTELDATSRTKLQSYLYSDVSGISFPNDAPDTIVFRFHYAKVLVYTCPQRASLVQSLQEQMTRLGLLPLPMEPSRRIQEWRHRSLDNTVVLSTWSVVKDASLRRPTAMPRELLVTNKSLVERDTNGMIVNIHSMQSISALVLYDNSGLEVEYEHNNTSRKYQVRKHRDALVVSILDVAPWIAVVSKAPTVSYRLASKESSNKLFSPVPVATYTLGRVQSLATHVYAVLSGDFSGNETPDQKEIIEYCQQIPDSPHGNSLLLACREFNLMETVAEFKIPVLAAVLGITEFILKLPEANRARREIYYEYVATLFYTAQRLLKCHPKMSADLDSLRELVPLIFAIESKFCKFTGLLVLQATLTGKEERDLEAEYVNKNVFFQSCGQVLVEGIVSCLEPGASDLILMVASNILQSILCSHQDTTTPDNFKLTLDLLATRDSALLATLRSPTPYVLENTALLLHLLSQHAVAEEIREAALGSGLVLEHFYKAIFSPLEGQRFLSRYLCSQWLTERLIKRMVPVGFLSYLNMPTISRVEEEQLDVLERDSIEGAESHLEAGAGTNMTRLRTRMANIGIPNKKNFRIFFHVLTQDHQMADLIWNTQTRRELRIALESEIELLKREEDKNIAWNHQQFKVDYPSLEHEVQVGKVYMRLWLQAGDAFIRSWEEPVRLFEHLFRRFLCEIDRNDTVTSMCIRCLERLYAIHASKIGPFTDAMIVVRTMSSTKNIEIQHRLLMLLTSVLGVDGLPENAEQLLNVESLSQLCQFVAWGHTNGNQVGNILARALGVHSRPMLSSGAGEKLAPSSSAEIVAGDLKCPPMWFVASTGRSPPPAELIRGPFRVSDLLRMMERNEISQYDLVTTSHVENYDGETSDAELQIDTGAWKRLDQVWQLRWQLCSDGNSKPLYSPSEIAVLALRALTSLVALHPSTDSHGVPYYPIPIAKRILCGAARTDTTGENEFIANPLPIICQALLCNDGAIIQQAATLILKLCEHNERAISKLYLTGLFFFVLSYTGSDFSLLAKLLKSTHLRQHFQSGFAATAKESELPVKERSVLGGMLPEGLLHIMTNYGYDRFAEVFVGSADTPEVIWTFDMRKHLIEMIRQHLGDLPLRLFQQNTMEYEYCPIPGVAYSRLSKELFCHSYYLHNLCDEERFPNWPIKEPIELFRACLGMFTEKQSRDESKETEELENARQVLQLEEGDGSKELRKAYRNLARKYHPDKNPSGRDMFEAIQKSYERLLPIVERGETIHLYHYQCETNVTNKASNNVAAHERKTLSLLIRIQLLVCRRFEQEMSMLKYPAYNILLKCLSTPQFNEDDHEANFTTSYHAEEHHCVFIMHVVELIFRTCLLSPMNAEGLVEEGGVAVLVSLVHYFTRIVETLSDQAADVDLNVVSIGTIATILSNAIHTLSGVAFFESGRAAFKKLSNMTFYLLDLKSCLDGSLFKSQSDNTLGASMRRFALEGIPSLARDRDLQSALVGCGFLWPLIRFTIAFDPTMERSSNLLEDQLETTTSAATSNLYAKLAVRALDALSGVPNDYPENQNILETLNSLFTPAIMRHFRNQRAEPILTTLNSNVEQADLIWNVEMRNHLEEFLDSVERERPKRCCNPLHTELQYAKNFQYKTLSDEIQVGGVYVRFFNKGGSSSLPHVINLGAFFDDIVAFVGRTLNSSLEKQFHWERLATASPTASPTDSPGALKASSLDSEEFYVVLIALRTLCQVEGLVPDSVKRGNVFVTSTMLSLLELSMHKYVDVADDILSYLSPARFFADAVVSDGTLWRLIQLLERKEPDEPPSGGESDEILSKSKAWSVLEALTSSPSVAAEILATTAWLELLGVIVGHQPFTRLYSSRLGAAKTLSRLVWDPSLGQLAESLLQKFLPQTLVCRLKDDPKDMIQEFDGTSDTPELIWNGDMRTELRATLCPILDDITGRFFASDRRSSYTLKPEIYVAYTRLRDELFIGGVYVSRFLKEPSFELRDPAGFLELLLQRWTKELEKATSIPASCQFSTNTTLTTPNQDVLEIVTTASVYICRVRETLCDKLAEWGYMAKCVLFLEKVLILNLIGSPLLTIMRMLHVASGRRSNVESLALAGHSDGRRGIVEFTIGSIGKEKLHDDCAFMIEFLKKTFELALALDRGQPFTNPSPAPGDGPVRRKVDIGDDPLGMFQPLALPGQTAPPFTQTVRSTTSQNDPQQQPMLEVSQQHQQHISQSFQGRQSTFNLDGIAKPNLSSSKTQTPQTSRTNQPQQHPQQFQYPQQRYPQQKAAPQPAQWYQEANQLRSSSKGEAPKSPYYEAAQEPHQEVRHGFQGLHQQQSTPSITTYQQQYQQTSGQIVGQHVLNQHGNEQNSSLTQQFNRMQTGRQALNPTMTPQQPTTPQSQHLLQGAWQQHSVSQSTQATAPSLNYFGSAHQMSPQVSSSSQSYHQQMQGHTPQGPGIRNVGVGFMPHGADTVQSGYTTQNDSQPLAQGDNLYLYHGATLGVNQQPSTSNQPTDQERSSTESTTQHHPYVHGSQSLPQSPKTKSQMVETFQGDFIRQSQVPIVVEGTNIVDARTPEKLHESADKQARFVEGAPGSAHGRVALLQQALVCDLCHFLVQGVLENPTLSNVRDSASAKVHAIDLVKLLCKDPGYGLKFMMILDDVPAWKRYVSQDHSLLINKPEQKSDYFLTNGATLATKLLTHE